MSEHWCKICGAACRLWFEDLFDDRHGYPGRFDIYQCPACGFGQTEPAIEEDRMAALYTRYYPRKNVSVEELRARSVVPPSRLRRWVLGVNNTAHYHIRRGTTVLDVGCGDCTSLREIRTMGSEAYGVEQDENVRGIAKAFDLQVHFGSLDEVAFPDAMFDYVTMSQVLEHFPRPAEAFARIRRLLKDDGQLIVGVPNVNSLMRRWLGRAWLNWHVPYHVNHFSRRSLERLAGRTGYAISRMRTYTPNLWVALQDRLVHYRVEEGVPVPFFNALPDHSPDKVLARSWPWILLEKLRLPFLRLVDLCGMGESFLVVFTKHPGLASVCP